MADAATSSHTMSMSARGCEHVSPVQDDEEDEWDGEIPVRIVILARNGNSIIKQYIVKRTSVHAGDHSGRRRGCWSTVGPSP